MLKSTVNDCEQSEKVYRNVKTTMEEMHTSSTSLIKIRDRLHGFV